MTNPRDVRALAIDIKASGVYEDSGVYVVGYRKGRGVSTDDVQDLAKAYLAADTRATELERDRDNYKRRYIDFAQTLGSISRNTCCARCQEAARWAQLALKRDGTSLCDYTHATSTDTGECAADTRATEAEQLLDRALTFIERRGYRRCDTAACNCGSWHGGKAEQQLAEALAELDTCCGCRFVDGIGEVPCQSHAAVEQRIATLTAALEEYGRHLPGCLEEDDTTGECSCGYDAALATPEGA